MDEWPPTSSTLEMNRETVSIVTEKKLLPLVEMIQWHRSLKVILIGLIANQRLHRLIAASSVILTWSLHFAVFLTFPHPPFFFQVNAT